MKNQIDVILLQKAREIVDNNFAEIETAVASLDFAAKLIEMDITKEEKELIDDMYDFIIKLQDYEKRT